MLFKVQRGDKKVIKDSYAFVPFMIILVLFAANVPSAAGPKLAFLGGPQVDLGDATEGQLKTGKFTIKNVGGKVLKIKNYIVTCGCLELVERRQPTLSPGESFDLELVFDTSGLAGKEARKSIIVFSNADNAPNRLHVTVEVSERKAYQVDSHEMTEGFDLFVDVRSPEAFEAARVIGSVNVPADEFSDWLPTVPAGVTLYLYSESGKKSDRLVEKFAKNSNPELKSLIGGFVQWKLRHESYIAQ